MRLSCLCVRRTCPICGMRVHDVSCLLFFCSFLAFDMLDTECPFMHATPALAASSAPFCWPVRVYWEDTDAGGVVYYANYLKFFERARTEWLRSMGLEQHALRASSGGVFVVSEAAIKYHRSARLDDALTITVRLQQAGKASVVFVQQAWREPPAPGVSRGDGCAIDVGAARLAAAVADTGVAAESSAPTCSASALSASEQGTAHGHMQTPIQTQTQTQQGEQHLPRELLAEATIRVGWVKADTMQPARMPPQVLQALAVAQAGTES